MNTQPTPSEDPLEALLRKNQAPLTDEGFTARVLATLPPPAPKPRKLPNRRVVACALGALTGLIWALAHSKPSNTGNLASLNSALLDSFRTIANPLSDPTVLSIGALILVSLTFAYFREIIAKLE